MNVAFYSLGIILILVAKIWINNRLDHDSEYWRRVFEIPSDVTFLALMMGLAGMSKIGPIELFHVLVAGALIIASMLSVVLSKKMVHQIVEVGSDVEFDSMKVLWWWLLGAAISLASAVFAWKYLGANL